MSCQYVCYWRPAILVFDQITSHFPLASDWPEIFRNLALLYSEASPFKQNNGLNEAVNISALLSELLNKALISFKRFCKLYTKSAHEGARGIGQVPSLTW